MNFKMTIAGLGLLITSTINAGPIIASATGPFQNYTGCEITKNSVIYKMEKLVETKYTRTDSESLMRLAPKAIAGIQNTYYRWFISQTDYNITNEAGDLLAFYSFGVKNTDNNSSEAKELIENIDTICTNSFSDFKILGEFVINLKIGNQILIDELIIEKNVGSFGIPSVSGKYIVPNSFTSKISNLQYTNGQFSFDIRVQEGDEDYYLTFIGSFEGDNKISGNAKMLSNGEHFGSFTGERK